MRNSLLNIHIHTYTKHTYEIQHKIIKKKKQNSNLKHSQQI